MSWEIVHAVIDDRTVFGNEKLVAIYLANYCRKDGTNAYPSIETISARTGLSRSTVSRCLGRLVEIGFLRVDQRSGQHHSTHYSFMFGLPQPSQYDLSGNSQPSHREHQPSQSALPAESQRLTNQENLFKGTRSDSETPLEAALRRAAETERQNQERRPSEKAPMPGELRHMARRGKTT